MPADALKCKECQTTYPLEARFVCERCFGPLEVSYTLPEGDPAALKRRIQAGPHTMWRYADFLPLEGPARSALPTGWTPLVKADRLAAKLGLGELYIKNETANPTHSFKDRVVSVALARARELGFDTLACASTGNLANAVAAHAAAAGMPAYVLIPHDLEEQKVLATGAYGAQIVAVRGNYDDVNRLCTEVSGERPGWAFVNINMRPYYAEGSKTLAFETVEQLGWELPDRIVGPIASGSQFTKIARGFQEFIDAGLVSGVDPGDERGAGARLLAGRDGVRRGHRRVPSGQAGHDRQVAGDRQPGRRAVRDRARAPDRRRHRLRHRRRDPRRDPAAGRDDGHLHRDRRRRDDRDAGQARRARGHRARRARGGDGHGRRPEDDRRRARHVRRSPRSRRRWKPSTSSSLRRWSEMAVTVKLPTQLRDAAGGATSVAGVDGGTVGEALEGLYSEHGELRERIADGDGSLRRFVNVYLKGEDIRFLDGLDTAVSDGDEVTILPAVAGG